jgi:hypothetical protein
MGELVGRKASGCITLPIVKERLNVGGTTEPFILCGENNTYWQNIIQDYLERDCL